MDSARYTVNPPHAGRVLASRDGDGIHVLLLWHPNEDALTVSVDDSRFGHRFAFAVERDRGLQAFYHPFAYAASRSLVHHDAEHQPSDLRQQV
jgi:hypothetical protein